MPQKVITRVPLDVCPILDTVITTGPVRNINQVADLRVDPTHCAKNSHRTLKAIAQAIVAQESDFQVHVSPHVWLTLEYKLVNPSAGASYKAWSPEDAARTVATLVQSFETMAQLGWTVDVEGDHSQHSLNNVVPAAMRKQPYGIDNEDRKVLVDALAAAALPEWDETVPVFTVLVTNDGGLQLANEFLGKTYESFSGTALPVSFSVMYPSHVAAMLEKSSTSVRKAA